jgi:hypothetical protein
MHELNSLFLNNRHHEFKFENLGYPNLAKYKLLVDLVFNYDISFYGVIVDKTSPDFNIEKYGNYWHAYTKYLKLLLSQPDEDYHLINILDFLHKPNSKEEVVDAINTLENVVNSIQLDSKNTPLLQIADLLLGAAVFSKKIKIGIVGQSNKTKARIEFCSYLNSKIIKKQTINKLSFVEIINFGTKK